MTNGVMIDRLAPVQVLAGMAYSPVVLTNTTLKLTHVL